MERKRRTTEALIENMKEEALLALDNTNKSAHDEGYKEGVRFISKGTFELHRNQLTSKKELIKNLTEELQHCHFLIEEYRKNQ